MVTLIEFPTFIAIMFILLIVALALAIFITYLADKEYNREVQKVHSEIQKQNIKDRKNEM